MSDSVLSERLCLRDGKIERPSGGAFACAKCCKPIRNEDVTLRFRLPGLRRAQRIACPSCGVRYTLEVSE